MAKLKQETVSASFHYLTRTAAQGNGKSRDVPFSNEEFDALLRSAKSAPVLDPKDPVAADKLKLRMEVPLSGVEAIDERTFFGRFMASYYGHAYDNTVKGRIPADSISLRPFFFLAYLSESGRIYIASQYLGLFGGYAGLQRTLVGMLPDPKSIIPHSFRLSGSYYKNAAAKEIHVSFSDHATSIAADNSFAKRGILVFKKESRDDGFEAHVSKRLLPLIGGPASAVKKAVAEIVSDSNIMDFKDADVEDCTIIANVNGKRKTIYLIEDGNTSTRFPLDVPIDADGHPKLEQTKKALLATLRDEIIARKEDV